MPVVISKHQRLRKRHTCILFDSSLTMYAFDIQTPTFRTVSTSP